MTIRGEELTTIYILSYQMPGFFWNEKKFSSAKDIFVTFVINSDFCVNILQKKKGRHFN